MKTSIMVPGPSGPIPAPEGSELRLGVVDGLANAPLTGNVLVGEPIAYDSRRTQTRSTLGSAVYAMPPPPPGTPGAMTEGFPTHAYSRRYVLRAGEEGFYQSDWLIGLAYEVVKHRLWHFCRGDGWRD